VNLGVIRSRCKARFRDLSGVLVTDATWNGHINEGIREMIASSPHWPFLEGTANLTITPPSNSVNLPVDVWKVLAVHNVTDEYAMDEMVGRRSRFDQYPATTLIQGYPEEYRLLGRQLQVLPFPTVATTVTVEYSVSPADLALDGDLPVFPAQYHQALVYYALSCALEDDEKRADHFSRRFIATLDKMRADLLSARGDSYPSINDNFF